MPRIARVLAAVLLGFTLIVVAACRASGPEYVSNGKSYSATSVMRLLDTKGPEGAAVDANEATDRRHDALTALRAQGGGAAKAATLITASLPAETRGVPYYAEWATFDSTPALVVLEVTGRKGGPLADRRVWVLDKTGAVLFSGMGRN